MFSLRVSWVCLWALLLFSSHVEGVVHLDTNSTALVDRQTPPPGQCSNSIPCSDGSCCNGITFFCGRDPAHCDASVCVSDCNAKAECGVGASTPGQTCPLNVCCSSSGFCGVTEDFCDTGCQSNCDQPGSTGLNTGNVQNLVIGYFEAWTLLERGCATITISDIPTDSLTHLNVAFGYIQPSTYTIYPIPGAGVEQFQQITNLKQRAPGLQVWLSLGGWSFSDNGTDTQPVFGDLASTSSKRAKFIASLSQFMSEWGFDGVDIDWEYPGAPDRNGNPEDTANYVLLLSDMRTAFDTANRGWGISFTAPTSYWYLQWFDVNNMVKYADWMNLMTYDLHGSWDSPADDIGSVVLAHTNLTEITAAFDLLWRNNVPAGSVNMGLGFYGRTYTLADTSCTAPGCPFSDPGVAGPCTGTPGFLSYYEIQQMMETNSFKAHYDEVAGVNYMVFDKDQWVSFDDARSIAQKVDYANKNGLGGLFIWAIDEDSPTHTLLNATLQPDGLGKFKGQTGSGFTDSSNFSNVDISQCTWTSCGSTAPSCAPGLQLLTTNRCDLSSSGSKQYESLCCPFGNTPDPAFCHWETGSSSFLNNLLGVCNSNGCPAGTLSFGDSSWAVVDNSDVHCFFGDASYCCDIVESSNNVCGWSDTCVHIDDTGFPVESNACPSGRSFVTWAQATGIGASPKLCGGLVGSVNADTTYQSFCCDDAVGVVDYQWQKCGSSKHCPAGYVTEGYSYFAEGVKCNYNGQFHNTPVGVQLCVNANSLSLVVNNLPVPLADLFETPGPSSDKQTWNVYLDSTMGGADPTPNESTDPDDNSFGWYIMSGPSSEITTMDKRDGSHWDVYDCEHEGLARQTAKAVCTDESEGSNCGVIWTGRGVAETVIEMPPGCGAGRYAMAVSLDPSVNQTLPNHLRHLQRRGRRQPLVYDLTFDFDFTPLQRRAESNVLLRIDYSNDPGYWSQVVAAAPGRKRSVKDMHEIVRRDHGGSWPRFLEHEWRQEKRSTSEHELHLLHERWFSATLADWLSKQLNVDTSYTLFRHTINQQLRWFLFQDELQCTLLGIPTKAYFAAWADLDINIQSSSELTLIGNLGDLSTFQESHVLVRNSGTVKTSLNLEAAALLKFTTGQVKLVGADTFGATFTVPGLVTIGPNFEIFGELSGEATLHAETRVDFDIASWDYTQVYPAQSSDEPPDQAKAVLGTYGSGGPDDSPKSGPQFYYDVGAEGQITLSATAQASFGIVWTTAAVPDTSINLGVTCSVNVFGSVGSSSDVALEYCYGANLDAQVYASIEAPAIFGISNRWLLWSPGNGAVPIIEQTCSAADDSPQTDQIMNSWTLVDEGV